MQLFTRESGSFGVDTYRKYIIKNSQSMLDLNSNYFKFELLEDWKQMKTR